MSIAWKGSAILHLNAASVQTKIAAASDSATPIFLCHFSKNMHLVCLVHLLVLVCLPVCVAVYYVSELSLRLCYQQIVT